MNRKSIIKELKRELREGFLFYFGAYIDTERNKKLEDTMKNFFRTIAVIAVAFVGIHFFGWMVGIALVGGYIWGSGK